MTTPDFSLTRALRATRASGIVSTLLTNSFVHVRLLSGLACLSNLAESDQITGPNIEMAKYPLSPQVLRSRPCSGARERAFCKLHVKRNTQTTGATHVFFSAPTR
jgi:hypothetical protein